MEKKRYYNIDFLRIVLINAILLHHFLHAATGVWNRGGLAVEFFFIIAGFLFNLTFKIQQTTLDFIAKKLIRFMPLLIFTSLTLAFCTKFRIQIILADLFLLQKTGLWTANGGFGYNSPAWFIAVLFWVLLFIFYLRKNTNEKITNLILGGLTFYSLIIIANNLHPAIRIFGGLGSIGIGYFCAELVKVLPAISQAVKSKFVTLVEITMLSYLSYILFTSSPVSNKIGIMFLMGILVLLFYCQKGYVSAILNKPIFTKISAYVFPIYITHSIFYHPHPFFKYFHKLCDDVLIVCITGITVSWIFGIFAYYVIEKPVAQYMSRLYNDFINKVTSPGGPSISSLGPAAI